MENPTKPNCKGPKRPSPLLLIVEGKHCMPVLVNACIPTRDHFVKLKIFSCLGVRVGRGMHGRNAYHIGKLHHWLRNGVYLPCQRWAKGLAPTGTPKGVPVGTASLRYAASDARPTTVVWKPSMKLAKLHLMCRCDSSAKILASQVPSAWRHQTDD